MLSINSGKIFQLAYIVPNIDEAVAAWAKLTGTGPFVVIRHQQFVSAQYRGDATHIDVSLAFGFSGESNIELIEVHGDTPCVYSDFVKRRGYGLQHIGVLSDDIDRDSDELASMGAAEIQRSVDTNQTETRFFDTEGSLGTTLELIRSSEALRASFGQLKDMADAWDGKTALIDMTPTSTAE